MIYLQFAYAGSRNYNNKEKASAEIGTNAKIIELDIMLPAGFNRQHDIKSPAKGIFYSDLKSGDQVSIGQMIGYTTDVFGKHIAEINSDQNGIIL